MGYSAEVPPLHHALRARSPSPSLRDREDLNFSSPPQSRHDKFDDTPYGSASTSSAKASQRSSAPAFSARSSSSFPVNAVNRAWSRVNRPPSDRSLSIPAISFSIASIRPGNMS